jgi:hypothetical protein
LRKYLAERIKKIQNIYTLSVVLLPGGIFSMGPAKNLDSAEIEQDGVV